MNESNLHEYQKRAVRFVEDNPYCLLLLDMGLGKTVTTLTAISHLIDESEVSKVLVVAPKKVAESTWAQEVRKWNHLRHLTVSTVLGTAKQRAVALCREADIYVTSRDLFQKIVETGRFPFDMVVLDELTSFKSSKAQRFKAFKAVRPRIARVVGLTGTPAPNGMKDLWAQMYCIDMGQRLGRYKHNFESDFFDIYKHGHIPIRCDMKRGAGDTILQKIGDICLTMKAEDYLSLPPLIEQTVTVKLSEKARALYDEFERESVLDFMDKIDGASDIAIAANAAAMTNKLLQFANGALYDEDRNVREFHQEKMDALMELIEQAQASGESVLVFYQFQHDLMRALKRKELHGLRVRKYEGDDDLLDWNAGKIDVLFTHAASTAYGLNLQQGGHVIVWYGTGFNAELFLQGNARLRRQGQKCATRVYKLCVEDTVDEAAVNAVGGKIDRQEAMLQALKERAKRYGYKV